MFLRIVVGIAEQHALRLKVGLQVLARVPYQLSDQAKQLAARLTRNAKRRARH